MKNRKMVFCVIFMLATFVLEGCAFVSVDLANLIKVPKMQEKVLYKGSQSKVLVVEVLGILTDTHTKELFMTKEGTLERLDEILSVASEDQNIKGVILKIDSPGGSATASDLLYRRIIEFKKAKKIPVVSCIVNSGTSGAYMTALSSDRIIALPTSMIGNIGVLLPSVSYQGLMDMLGVHNQAITSGKYKDAGTPMRDMTEDDKGIYKAIVGEMFDDFISKVKKDRPGMTEEDLKIAGDGRIMAANFALKHHLIDEIGYYENALKGIEKLSGVMNPTVVVYRRFGESDGGFYSCP
jgi:protease-4